MWQIVRGLYLGDRRDAYDRDMLIGMGVTHVLNCAREVPCWYRTDFCYRWLRLRDPDAAFCEHIDGICRFIQRGRKRGGVLVHCAAGLSRSPSAILAYLCWRGKSLDAAVEFFSRRVEEHGDHFILPDPSFLEQIEIFFESRDEEE